VSLTPSDIENQVFKERFRGYDQEEVDSFLDRVSTRISELTAERDQLSSRLQELESTAGESAESEKLLQRTLVSAQRIADETVSDARSQAEQTLSSAREQADETLTSAREEAETLVSQARERAATEEERATVILERVRRAVGDLARFRAEYRERVQGVIAEQLALLDRSGELPELPPELENLAHLEPADARDVAVSYGGEDEGR
jgi:cell division initiation protein